MKENSIFTTGLFVLALLLLLLSVGKLLGENDVERYKVSVIVDHSVPIPGPALRWDFSAAGRAYNIEFNFVPTDRLVSIQQEKSVFKERLRVVPMESLQNFGLQREPEVS